MKLLSKFIRHITLGKWVPLRIAEQWSDGFQTNAGRINEKRLMKIPNEAQYQNRVVGPAVNTYKNILRPDFRSKAGLTAQDILNKHQEKLGRSFDKYHHKLNVMFESVDGVPAKRFKDAVANARSLYAKGMARTLPFTGTRAEGLGVAPFMAYWLTGEETAVGLVNEGDLMEGGPVMVCKITQRSGFKSALNQRIIQAGALMVNSEFDPPVVKEQNDQTNELVQNYVDPGLNLYPFQTGGASHLDFIIKEADFYLELVVMQK